MADASLYRCKHGGIAAACGDCVALADALPRAEQAEEHVEYLRRQVELERNVNAASGCPDCGVHARCAEVVAERDRLRAVVERIDAYVQAAQIAPDLDAAQTPLGKARFLYRSLADLRAEAARLEAELRARRFIEGGDDDGG